MMLVFVADDLGYCPRRSQGIFEVLESGKVSRASLMVNVEKYSLEAGKRCLPFKDKIGLHFNITEGQPLSRPVPQTLVDKNGFFLGKKGFWSAHDKMDAEEIRLELITQISRFKEICGFPPAHVDGHQHAHVAPNVWNVFISSLSGFGIKRTRLPIELGLEDAEMKLEQARYSFYKSVQEYAKAARKTLPVEIKERAQRIDA